MIIISQSVHEPQVLGEREAHEIRMLHYSAPLPHMDNPTPRGNQRQRKQVEPPAHISASVFVLLY